MRYALIVIVIEAVIAAILFGAAGRFDLPWVWALLAIHAVFMAALVCLMDPDLRRERMGRRRGGGPDRWLRGLLTVTILSQLVVAGLDLRFGWSPQLPDAAHAAGLVVYAAGLLLAVRAMIVNRFFVCTVRIQPERGHVPVTDGPYRFLRHPGYAGMALAVVAECFVFGSLWALISTVAFAVVLVVRTAREDRLLRDQLAGYADYARGVRYRLVPAVW